MKGNYKYIAGIDEVGRGSLAGPVSVCVFFVSTSKELFYRQKIQGIQDSKKLASKQREYFFKCIQDMKQEDCSYAISHISAKLIDIHGIKKCLFLALQKALEKIKIPSNQIFLYLDGRLKAPDCYQQKTIIRGDQKIWQISSASVIAKVLRDKKMKGYAKKYPEYFFDQHKGYGTFLHRNCIKKYGTCSLHRLTWLKKITNGKH